MTKGKEAYHAVLCHVAEALHKNMIPWCIIRNYEFLLKKDFYEGGDLDIVIQKKDLRSIRDTLKEIGFIELRLSPFTHHKAFFIYVPEAQRCISIHLHLDNVHGQTLAYFSGERLLKNRKKSGDFYVPDDTDYLANIILHCLLNKNGFIEKYKPRIQTYAKMCSYENLVQALSFALPMKWSKAIAAGILTGALQDIEKYKKSIKQSFRRKKGVCSHYTIIWKSYLWGLSKIFHQAPLVSFIGMDGAGKSTATEHLHTMFGKSLVKSALLYTGRGKHNILPIQFFGRKIKKKLDASDKKKHLEQKKTDVSLQRKLLFMCAAPFFVLDLYVRYWFKIFPQRLRCHIVITDRYSSDILLMKHVPQWMRSFMYFFFPKPTMTIYLYNDPEVLHKRKPDHDIADLYRQEELFKGIIRKTKAVTIQSTTEDQTFDIIISNLLKILI